MVIHLYFPSGANVSDNPSCIVSRGNIGHIYRCRDPTQPGVIKDITTGPRCMPDSESLHEDVLDVAKTLEKGTL